MEKVVPDDGSTAAPSTGAAPSLCRRFFGDTRQLQEIDSSRVYPDIIEIGWVHSVPGLNLLYDIFFDAPPMPEDLEKALNVIALVAALMLSVVGSLTVSMRMLLTSWGEFAPVG